MNESISTEILLSTYKKVMSLHKKYDEPNDVIDDAINVLTRGPTLRDFFDYLDLLKNVTSTRGFSIESWIKHIERTYSEEELKTFYILDYIHSLEGEEESLICEKIFAEHYEKLREKWSKLPIEDLKKVNKNCMSERELMIYDEVLKRNKEEKK